MIFKMDNNFSFHFSTKNKWKSLTVLHLKRGKFCSCQKRFGQEVGRAVASNTRGLWFESSHRQKYILNVYCQLYWKDENEGLDGHFFRKKNQVVVVSSQCSELETIFWWKAISKKNKDHVIKTLGWITMMMMKGLIA